MENEKTKTKNKYLGVIIFALVISLIGLAYPIYAMIALNALSLEGIVKILCYLFVLYYLFIGYKKPHGNLMKILFMLFAFTVLLQAIATAKINDNAAYLIGTAAIFVAYASGKLNKVKNNQIIAVIVFCLLILGYGLSLAQASEENLILKLASLDLVVEWVAIITAYFVRYKMHKDSGKELDKLL